MNKNTGGKGSGSRPLSVPLEVFGEKHTAIFGERKRTNGGWTPPPLPTETQKEVDLPSGAKVTLTMLKERPQTHGDYKFSFDPNIVLTDEPTVTEDGMAIPEKV